MTLSRHLRRRLDAAYRQLQRSLEDLSEDDALHGGQPNWRRYRFGNGLDGSIPGMVRHLALWKRLGARGLESGVFPEASSIPLPERWSELPNWLAEGHRELALVAGRLADEALDEKVSWEGHEMTRADLLAHLIEHDHYHAGQINLIRQQLGHVFPEP